MELKLQIGPFPYIISGLLIAPLMELKSSCPYAAAKIDSTFNRTAYGIEIEEVIIIHLNHIASFNRTAYGIEIALKFRYNFHLV